MSAVPRGFVILALLMEAGYCLLVARQQAPGRVVDAVAILLGSFAVYLISAGLILRKPQSFNHLGFIMGTALLFRLTIWPLYPSFTDDLYRYRWEARLQLAGGNPYATPPNDPAFAFLQDETFDRIPGRDFRAVYGPFTELVYRWTYAAVSSIVSEPRDQVFWLKLPGAIFDLGVLAGLWMLLPAAGFGRERILIYAWSPLPVFEFWGNGHNDSLALFPLVLAILGARRERWTAATSLVVLAAAAKVWPAGLLALFWRPGRWRASIAGALLAVGLLIPFGWGLLGNLRFLSGFLGGWRNNDSIHGILLWATGDQYPAKYTAFAIVAAAIAVSAIWIRPVSRGCLTVLAVMLAVSANCHPWYLTWLLPFLVLHPSLALLLWTGLIPIGYQALPQWELLGEWNGSTPLRLLIYLPVAAVAIWECRTFLRGGMMESPAESRVPG